mmetsp:Transcript_51870/g.97312  ORF Transcript_51870/g.97312 Transcript_51870/m.97312 type:complete len:201 (-) Transcript_51870:546-1148(-)
MEGFSKTNLQPKLPKWRRPRSSPPLRPLLLGILQRQRRRLMRPRELLRQKSPRKPRNRGDLQPRSKDGAKEQLLQPPQSLPLDLRQQPARSRDPGAKEQQQATSKQDSRVLKRPTKQSSQTLRSQHRSSRKWLSRCLLRIRECCRLHERSRLKRARKAAGADCREGSNSLPQLRANLRKQLPQWRRKKRLSPWRRMSSLH